ncbi:MAG: hypothetical protein VZQ81_07660 [Succiniclasticum sp.]|nr:hypothetical protein [Succiniclasticum sp.]MEE3479883.1 hypothetical protein [Succiniclasticum sp.]
MPAPEHKAEGKRKTSHASRFIALGIAIIAAAAALFYFGYWTRTPQYTLHCLIDAIRAKDIAYVDQHADGDQIFSRLFDETIEFTFGAQDSDSVATANPALKRYLGQSKGLVVPVLEQQARNWIITGDPRNTLPIRIAVGDTGRGTAMARAMADRLGIFNLQYRSLGKVEQNDKAATAELTFHDRQLDEDLPVLVRMQEKDGVWKVVSFGNLEKYMKARQKAIKARLDKLNAPIREQIAESVIVETDGDKAPSFKVLDDPSPLTGSSLEGTFTLTNKGTQDILSVAGMVEVKDATGVTRFRNSFESQGIAAGQSVKVENEWPLDIYVPNQSILATKSDEKLTAVMTIQYVIFKGGKSISLLESLPDDRMPKPQR